MEFKEITDVLQQIYEEKNREYGDSFSELFKKLGPISAITQIVHKTNRLINSTDEDRMEDTLIDLANYSIMTLMEIKKYEKTTGDI